MHRVTLTDKMPNHWVVLTLLMPSEILERADGGFVRVDSASLSGIYESRLRNGSSRTEQYPGRVRGIVSQH